MSPTSSGSWRYRAVDIIDLDKYMRGAVKPSRTDDYTTTDCEFLEYGMKANLRQKRYSHDSGVSDSSYSRCHRNSRPHRRYANGEFSSTRPLHGSESLRAFRLACEQALLDQQRQIAHVAQICEKLSKRVDPSLNKEHERKRCSNRKNANETLCYTLRDASRCKRLHISSGDVSDISSSSFSTCDQGWKDRHRSQQCKTYKLIMRRLDELNHMFACRSPRAGARPPPSPSPSRSSVSVCDKLVATEQDVNIQDTITPLPKLSSTRLSVAQPASGRTPRRVAHTFAVDIAPDNIHSARDKSNVAVENVVKQRPSREIIVTRFQQDESTNERSSERASASLCSLCRAYLRALRNCLTPHI